MELNMDSPAQTLVKAKPGKTKPKNGNKNG